MTQVSTKGWIRLGIVVSVTWLILVFSYAVFDYFRVNSMESGWQQPERSGPLPVETRPISLLTECGYEGKETLTTCSPRYLNLMLLVLGPIALGWLPVLLVYGVLWVRAGFRDKES